MAKSNIKVIFQKDIQIIWTIVTDLQNYQWRTDLSKIEILNEKQFIEYSKTGYATNFTTTYFEPYKRWEFIMENENMSGYWIGIFTQIGEKTKIDFTENVTAKKLYLKPFVKAYLKKQQKIYIQDLTQKLKVDYE